MMRRGLSAESGCLLLPCPSCDAVKHFEMVSLTCNSRCKRCHKLLQLFECRTCTIQQRVCRTCFLNVLKFQNPEFNDEKCDVKAENNIKNCKLICAIVVVVIILLFIFLYVPNILPKQNVNGNISELIKSLKKTYPSQKSETWAHFLSVLEQKIPSVKTITFLYSRDKRTSDCLINELVFLFSGNKSIANKEITFSNIGFERGDYGLALEHYHAIVRKFRVIIADLTQVSGNLARIFHSLCDEVSSDVKPSLFIFTLKYDKKLENLKAITRVTGFLEKQWSALPASELFPLLSRVVKNVIEIIPETDPC